MLKILTAKPGAKPSPNTPSAPPFAPIAKPEPFSREHHQRTIFGLLESAMVHLSTAEMDGLLEDVVKHCLSLQSAREGTLPVADTLSLCEAMKRVMSGGSSTPLPPVPVQAYPAYFARKQAPATPAAKHPELFAHA